MPPLLSIELDEHLTTVVFVIENLKQIQCFGNTSVFGDGSSECRRHQHDDDGEYYDGVLADRVEFAHRTELLKCGPEWFYHEASTGLWEADPCSTRPRTVRA